MTSTDCLACMTRTLEAIAPITYGPTLGGKRFASMHGAEGVCGSMLHSLTGFGDNDTEALSNLFAFASKFEVIVIYVGVVRVEFEYQAAPKVWRVARVITPKP